MAIHSYVQTEDLGFSVLGTPQVAYTVDGEHTQDYDVAVYRAALCRTTALEETLSSYNDLITARQSKIDDLGEALALVNAAVAEHDKLESGTEIEIGYEAVSLLRRNGIETANGEDVSSTMEYQHVAPLIQDIEFAIDQEDNEIQQNMTQMQSYVSKRDDAMQMSSKFMTKIASTRQQGIKYIGS